MHKELRGDVYPDAPNFTPASPPDKKYRTRPAGGGIPTEAQSPPTAVSITDGNVSTQGEASKSVSAFSLASRPLDGFRFPRQHPHTADAPVRKQRYDADAFVSSGPMDHQQTGSD